MGYTLTSSDGGDVDLTVRPIPIVSTDRIPEFEVNRPAKINLRITNTKVFVVFNLAKSKS